MENLSDQNLNHPSFNHHLISLNPLRYGKAFASAHIKLPPVPIAFDYMFAKYAGGQRRAFMWTEVFGGIEFAIDIVKSKLATLWKVNSLTTPRR